MWPNAYAPLFGNTSTGIEQLAPTVVAASTSVTAATQLPGNVGGDPSNLDISIENTTNGWAFCNFGDASVPNATVNNGVGVPPGTVRIVRVAPTTGFVSVILAAAATTGPVRFLRGSGIT